MIYFLRKIRKKLINADQLNKYLLYAIGEILLVVLGILIALQINNWNNSNLEKNELNGYLVNVKKNLLADQENIQEVALFRDSTVFYSQLYLKLANEEKIATAEFERVMNTRFNVFFDSYFKVKNSGFEALKNSGYIGKLHGTELEENLNEYYYIVEKIDAQEKSLYNTIETMENEALNKNVMQELFKISQIPNLEQYINLHQDEVKRLLNHPNLIGANFRNALVTTLPKYYLQIEELGKKIVSQIDVLIDLS